MKNIVLTLIAVVSFCTANAQKLDRSQPPAATAPRALNFGEVEQFLLKNGVTVLVIENHKLPQVRMDMYLNNGPLKEAGKAGYAAMLGDLMKAGTTTKTKEQIDEEIDYLGTDFYFGSRGFGISSLKKQLMPSLGVFTDILFNPTFTNQEVLDKLKKQAITGLESEAKNPDAISRKVTNVLLYGKNDPWGESSTEETLSNIELADVKDLYNKQVIPNNCYITFVGDITMKEAKKIAKKYFKNWEKKDFTKPTYPLTKNTSGNYIAFVDLPTATQSSINIIGLNELKKSNPDYFAAVIGNSILGGGGFSTRLFQNLREDKGWTYGAYSSLSDDNERMGDFSASAKVRNAVTDSAVVEFMKEINILSTELASDKELKDKLSSYNGKFALGLENPATIGRFVRTQLIEDLPNDYYKNYLKNINAVDANAIKAAMNKYVDQKNLVILVVGKAVEVLPSLEKLGMPIKYYDTKGNKADKPKMSKPIPAGVTTKTVLDNAVKALGNVQNVKTLKTVYTGSIQGQDVVSTTKKMTPNLFVTQVDLPAMGMTAMKMVFDGKSGSMAQMGQSTDLPKEMSDELMKSTSIFDAVNLSNRIKDASLQEIAPLNGKDAYKVLLKSGESKAVYYFDTTDFNLLQTTTTSKNPANGEDIDQTINYSDYTEMSGVNLPGKIVQALGPGMNLELKIKEAVVNKDVTKADFK